MYFGDFLVKKNLVTSSQLLQALSFQLENMPSMLRVVIDSNIVSSDKLLDVINSKLKSDEDLLSILVNANLITTTQMSELEMKQISCRKPLGEVLVELKFLKQETLASHIDTYFAEKNTATTQMESSQSAANESISEAALESLRELGIDFPMESAPEVKTYSPKEEVVHFLNVFTQKQKDKMIKMIEVIGMQSNDQLINYLNSLFRDIHLIKGSIFIADIGTLRDPVTLWDESIEKVLLAGHVDSSVGGNWCDLNLARLKKFLENLWLMRESINEYNTDECITKDFEPYMELKKHLPAVA